MKNVHCLKRTIFTLLIAAIFCADWTPSAIADEPPPPKITLNTHDINTVVDLTSLGLTGTSLSLAQNESLSFQLEVPEAAASKYFSILRGNTTGITLNLKITDPGGSLIFDKVQTMVTRKYDIFSGIMNNGGRHMDNGVVTLNAGVYTVTLTNTSETTYDFINLEFRNVVLPLADGLTAFHATDAYYQNIFYWHSSNFEYTETTPPGATAVGGTDFHQIIMQEIQGPDLRFYIDAQTAGFYELSVRTCGKGGLRVSVNDSASYTIMEQTSTRYEYKIDRLNSAIYLNEGQNKLVFTGGGPANTTENPNGNETGFNCFMLKRFVSVWPTEQALEVTNVQDTSISFAWHPQSVELIDSFEIYANDLVIDTVSSDTTNYTVSGLSPSKQYKLVVNAILKDGSNYDTERSITVSTESFLSHENELLCVSAGRSHLIGINKNGKIQIAGSNRHGQANNNLSAYVTDVEAGGSSSYAVDTAGNAYSWGSNFYGQLGIGSDALLIDVPTKISNLSNVIQIAAGAEHALALTSDGNVYAFGNNRYGQLGIGDMFQTLQKNTPALVTTLQGKQICSVYAGSDTSYAISADGTLYSWGANYLGQLGDGNDALDNRDIPYAISISGMKVLSVAGGGSHTIALCYPDINNNNIQDDDESTSVWVWGADTRGQLASGDLGQWKNIPQHLIALDDAGIVSLAAGDGHTLALSGDGTVYAWGWNEDGQLGTGSNAYSFVPVPVENLPKIKSITAGYAYSVALTETGRIYAWGANNAHQISDNETAYYNTPIIVNLSLQPISVGNIKLYRSGELVQDLQAGGAYVVSANCYNSSNACFDGKIYLCAYEMQNNLPQLLSATPVPLVLDGYNQKEITIDITLPDTAKNLLLKILVWNTQMRPYSVPAVIR